MILLKIFFNVLQYSSMVSWETSWNILLNHLYHLLIYNKYHLFHRIAWSCKLTFYPFSSILYPAIIRFRRRSEERLDRFIWPVLTSLEPGHHQEEIHYADLSKKKVNEESTHFTGNDLWIKCELSRLNIYPTLGWEQSF